MSTHTAGPWSVDGDDQGDFALLGVYIAKTGDGRIGQAFANCLVVDDMEVRANARLIAAAPELLEALQLASWEFEFSGTSEEINQIARDAIAKATEAA